MTLTDSALFMPERTPEEGRPVCSTASVEGDPKILKEENTYGKDDFSAASAYECQGCSLRRKPVDGAHMVHLFGDVATELLIKCDGDEGLFCAYDNVEFLAPVYAGDYIEAYGEIEKVGNTSRTMKFEARKVIVSRPDISASAADVLEEPIVVCRAHGTCVTPKDCQRKKIEK